MTLRDNNQSVFGNTAQRSKDFTFCLWDRGTPFRYSVVRNGASIACDGELTLAIPPEELVREQAARTTVTQTPHGSWTDSFGSGLAKWSLRGSTGWKARAANTGTTTSDGRQDGYTAIHVFSEMIQVYLRENQARSIEAFQSGRALRPLLQLVYHDHVDDEWWVIEPDGIPTKHRSQSRPLLYEYEFRFTGIYDMTQRVQAVLDPTGSALRGSDTRDQKTADAYLAALTTFEESVEDYDLAAQKNPSDAAAIDSITQSLMERKNPLEHESLDYPDADLALVNATAGVPAKSVFDISVPASALTKPTFLMRCQQVAAASKAIGVTVSDWRRKVTNFIASPFQALNDAMSGVRDLMNAVAFASNAFIMAAELRTALRILRTELRNLWCAGQSLLSFPYNFVQGLKATMQSFLNLFKLTGCATTFPRVPSLSWQAPQMTIPPALP